MFEKTITSSVECKGIGVHSGREVTLKMLPAPANTGIIFKRVDLPENNTIEANWQNVIDTQMCTVIANKHGVCVKTVEHLMSALWAHQIDNLIIEVNCEEMPIMDGSSAVFYALVDKVGTINQSAAREYIEITKTIAFEHGDKYIEISPSNSFEVVCDIDFDHQAIGKQTFTFADENSYASEVSRARTFGFAKDLEMLKSIGLAKGASLSNAVGIDENGVMNPEGLRFADEFARHKTLDCIGDLYLAGYPILGRVYVRKGGHHMHCELLKQIFSNTDSFSFKKNLVLLSN